MMHIGQRHKRRVIFLTEKIQPNVRKHCADECTVTKLFLTEYTLSDQLRSSI